MNNPIFKLYSRERRRSRSRSPRDKDRSIRDRGARDRDERDRGGAAAERRGAPPMKNKYWDVPPAGYEHMTPKEYKELQGLLLPHFAKNERNFCSFFSLVGRLTKASKPFL